MVQIFANAASSVLAAAINDTSLTVVVAPGTGPRFPAPGVGDYFLATLEKATGETEIVKVTGRVDDTMTIERAQEGTLAQSFDTNDRFELRATAGTLDRMLQNDGDTLVGDLDADGQAILNPAIKNADDTAADYIMAFPVAAQPTIGGRPIVTTSPGSSFTGGLVPIGGIIEWSGSVGTIPTGWALCDGNNGTPDLRGKFVIGAGGVGHTYQPGATGGAVSSTVTSTLNGSHNHAGTTQSHTLTVTQIPAHAHLTNIKLKDTRLRYANNGTISGPSQAAEHTSSGSIVVNTANTGGGGGHNHGITSDGDHTHDVTVPTLPPYYALAKIMRIS